MASADPPKMRKWKFSDHKMYQFNSINFIVRYMLQWINATRTLKRLAELMSLRVAQRMMQCLRCYWYDPIHKGEQNFIKILWQDKCYCARQLLKEFYHRQWFCLSLDQLLWVQRITDFLYWQLDSWTGSGSQWFTAAQNLQWNIQKWV